MAMIAQTCIRSGCVIIADKKRLSETVHFRNFSGRPTYSLFHCGACSKTVVLQLVQQHAFRAGFWQSRMILGIDCIGWD